MGAALLLGAVGRGNARDASAVDWHRLWVAPRDAAAALGHSDEYAWRLFVALNWPADNTSRGADAKAHFGAPGPVVWESWRTAGEVYRPDGADPGAWEGAPSRPAPQRTSTNEVAAGAARARFETVSLKDLPNARHVVGGVMVPWVDPLESAKRLTEIRMNRRAYEFIRARELYNIEGQLRAVADGIGVRFPYGSTEVKAKWRPITEAERVRYHTLLVTLADGTRRLYGLTALHIASKDLPTWFWATFEHVDNPSLADGDHWQLVSHDDFACRGAPADCNRFPTHIGLEDTVWQYYRLRGTLTSFVDAAGTARRLANSELESGFQTTASCMTCHARSSIAVLPDAVGPAAPLALRLPIFDGPAHGAERRGFIGAPQAQWFAPDGDGGPHFMPLDYVWSLSKAQPRGAARTAEGNLE